MYALALQYSSQDGTGLTCLIGIIVLIIVGIILATISSKTKNAYPYNQKVTTSLPRDQIVEIAKKHFPKSIISKSFNWESLWIGDHRFELKGYYLNNSQGCFTLLITGIIPGYLLIRLLMERTETVTIDFSEMEASGEITLAAKGLRARQEVDGLAQELGHESWLAKMGIS